MSGTAMKRFARETTNLLIHLAHGGLLMAGILVTVILIARLGMAQNQALSLQGIGSLIGGERAQPTATALPERAGAAGEVRAVADYLARRYRVAASAVEPLVTSAMDAGLRLRLDPLLIVAVMAVESGFNPIAESPVGAQGLMQVIPRYHQDKLEALRGKSSLLDPQANIQVGSSVLKESIRRAGSIEAGLQQYAGAVSDQEGLYAAKVLAERQRIESAARRGRQNGI